MKRHHAGLTRNAYAILVALADGPKALTKLQRQIIGDTLGVYVKPSSIHSAMTRFIADGWVERYGLTYHLTAKGWHHLGLETQTLERLVIRASQRLASSGAARWRPETTLAR